MSAKQELAKQEMVAELAGVNQRLADLRTEMTQNAHLPAEEAVLERQLEHLQAYADLLQRRINLNNEA